MDRQMVLAGWSRNEVGNWVDGRGTLIASLRFREALDLAERAVRLLGQASECETTGGDCMEWLRPVQALLSEVYPESEPGLVAQMENMPGLQESAFVILARAIEALQDGR